MKLIKKYIYSNVSEFYYDNFIIKKIYNGEVFWFKNYSINRNDGPAKENCIACRENRCWRPRANNKYNRHFSLEKMPLYILAIEFAKKTNHKICLICKDFCNQECFI